MKPIRALILACAAIAAAGIAAADEPVPPKLVVQLPDAERGKFLFATKGCVVCHSVNGIGGKAGPALDTESYDGEIDPLDFAARMWRGAQAMATLQSLNFGYQIDLTGGDIGDIAAFVSSDEHRSSFTEKDVPDMIRGWTIDDLVGTLGEEFGADPGDDGLADVTRGYVLAERWCTNCHVIVPNGDGGVAGPAFAEVAAREDATEEAIRGWLSQPHEDMPEFLNLTNDDIADVAGYIMSLRR